MKEGQDVLGDANVLFDLLDGAEIDLGNVVQRRFFGDMVGQNQAKGAGGSDYEDEEGEEFDEGLASHNNGNPSQFGFNKAKSPAGMVAWYVINYYIF